MDEKEVVSRLNKFNSVLTEVFPNVVRYTGVLIAIWETLFEKIDRPSILLLATGMIGLKTVTDAVKNGK